MGPRARYLGDQVPEEVLIWQDYIPAADHPLVNNKDVTNLKASILDSGLTVPELVRVAWASAASYRDTDMRGGANGARLRLAPQKDWPVNNPKEVQKVLAKLENIQTKFNKNAADGKKISLADMIVLGGATAIEKAAKDAGYSVNVPFQAGRMDASLEMTDVESFDVLEPTADAFRNYYSSAWKSPAEMLVERADLLPQMTQNKSLLMTLLLRGQK